MWFFEKVNAIDKPFFSQTDKKKERRHELIKLVTQSVITTDSNEGQNTIRNYCGNIFSKEMHSPEEVLKLYQLPKLSPEDVNSIYRPITSNKLNAVITSYSPLPTPSEEKSQGQMESLLNPSSFKGRPHTNS